MASGPAQTQLADPSFFQNMDPSLSQPLYRNREGILVGPLWSKGAPVFDLSRTAINTVNTPQTLTGAQVLGGFVKVVQSSGATLAVTLPTSTLLQQAISAYADSLVGVPNSDGSPGSGVIRAIELVVQNGSSVAGSTLTLTAGAGTPTQTIEGSAVVATGTTATFWIYGQRDSTGAASITIMRKA